VADDDAAMRAVVAEVLRFDGYDVEEAEHGIELLFRVSRALTATPGAVGIDVVVSDVHMPFCSGLDVLKKLRYARAKTPVVLMTGGGEDEMSDHVRELGAVLLYKPFTFDELRFAVAEVRGIEPQRRRVRR